MAAQNSSIPTTSLPLDSTEATVTVPDYGGLKRREADATIDDNWPQPKYNSENGKLASEAMSLMGRRGERGYNDLKPTTFAQSPARRNMRATVSPTCDIT